MWEDDYYDWMSKAISVIKTQVTIIRRAARRQEERKKDDLGSFPLNRSCERGKGPPATQQSVIEDRNHFLSLETKTLEPSYHSCNSKTIWHQTFGNRQLFKLLLSIDKLQL